MSAHLQVLLDRYGRPTITFEEAAQALAFNSIKTAYTARFRGKFPIRVIDLGGRLGCTIADLAEFLDSGIHQTDRPSEPQRKKSGRPSKTERARRLASQANS